MDLCIFAGIVALLLAPSTFRRIDHQFPDPALTRYRLGHVPKFTGLDERLYLRSQRRDLVKARQVLALRRLHNQVLLRRNTQRLRALTSRRSA